MGSLLEEHHGGRSIKVTANANAADGGIDLYISAGDDGSIRRAVQVKRRISGDVEAVKDVRNFVGAMVLEGESEGIFVTTASRFSKVAANIPQKALKAKCRLELDLIDGEKLLEMLIASNVGRPTQLPPLVEIDQEWQSSAGHVIVSRDLFAGDLKRLPL